MEGKKPLMIGKLLTIRA